VGSELTPEEYRAVRMMSLTRDPRVPKDLTEEQKSAIEQDPHLLELNQQRQDLRNTIKLEYGSVPQASGTNLYAEYTKLEKTIQSERQYLRRRAKVEIREQFFATIDTVEIEHQLLGSSITSRLKIDEGQAGNAQFTSAERERLAQNLFQSLNNCEDKKDMIHNRRLQVIRDWSALCNLQGTPYKRRLSSGRLEATKEETYEGINTEMFPTICAANQCLSCLGNDQLAYNARTYTFSSTDHLRRHVHDHHLCFSHSQY
jgi:hypothetical protein